MSTASRPDETINPVSHFVGVNLFTSDPALMTLVDSLPNGIVEQLNAVGEFWGSSEAYELGRLANENLPIFRPYDAFGQRIDFVEYHPSFHALMRRGIAGGLHCSVWDAVGAEAKVRTMARAARLFLAAEIDQSHVLVLAMNNAAIGALAHQPSLAEQWLPSLRSRKYDSTSKPLRGKSGGLLSFALSERQGGGDPLAPTSVARRGEDETYRLSGHKWFVSAPTADGFVTLAQTQEGVTALLVPRFQPDGSRNPFRLLRLKDKLGDRALATAEIEFDGALGFSMGQPGQGRAGLALMSSLFRLDACVISAALMRMAVAEAVHVARRRRFSGAALLDQPMMARVLADLALDAVGAAALVFRLAESFERAESDPAEAAFARLIGPAAKYWVCKTAVPLIAEAMECVGANGYVEESRLPRLYRGAPALALADAPGNIACLEVIKVLQKSGEPLEAVLVSVENILGNEGRRLSSNLRANAAVALADEGAARVFAERLAMTVAAAALRRSFPAVIADAFLESRMGREGRMGYGALDARFDAKAFVDFLYPPRD